MSAGRDIPVPATEDGGSGDYSMDLSTRDGRREQGDRIKQAARDAGLSLDELARRIGCSRALIYQYASGASLAQSDRLQQVAAAVGKPLAWFFADPGAEDGEATQALRSALAGDRAKIEHEAERLAAERARFEQRRAAEDIARLEALLAAFSSPPNPRRVVDCCSQLYPLLARDDDPRRLAAMLLQQGNALIQLQEWGPAREKLEEAGTLYRQAGEPVSARDCLQSLGHVNLMLGRVEEALRQFEEVGAGDDWTNRWQGTLSIGAAQEVLGNYAAAIAAFERAMEIVDERRETAGADVARLYIEANWANLELDFGDYEAAALRSERCVRAALRQAIQDQYMEAQLTHGAARLQLGDTGGAELAVRQALDVADLTGDQQHRSLALSYHSLCAVARQRAAEAIGLGKEALAVALRSGAVRAEIAAQRALGEAYLLSLNPSEALYHARQGALAAGGMRVRLPQSQFGALTSRALLGLGSAQEALAEAERALALADELHARPIQLECRLLLAEAALEVQDIAAAAENASAAIELARALTASHLQWRSQALFAEALARAQRRDESEQAFLAALAGLTQERAARESAGEDALMEDPKVVRVWRAWLRFLNDTYGAERARTAAGLADWPPFAEWLEDLLRHEDANGDA